jgi:hypothetical protein
MRRVFGAIGLLALCLPVQSYADVFKAKPGTGFSFQTDNGGGYSEVFALGVDGSQTQNSGQTIQWGGTTLALGADLNAGTLTDDTRKYALIEVPSWDNDNANGNAMFALAETADTFNVLNFGGGSANRNAFTQIRFYLGADVTTTTGTEVLRLDDDAITANQLITASTNGTYQSIIEAGSGVSSYFRVMNPTRTTKYFDVGTSIVESTLPFRVVGTSAYARLNATDLAGGSSLELYQNGNIRAGLTYFNENFGTPANATDLHIYNALGDVVIKAGNVEVIDVSSTGIDFIQPVTVAGTDTVATFGSGGSGTDDTFVEIDAGSDSGGEAILTFKHNSAAKGWIRTSNSGNEFELRTFDTNTPIILRPNTTLVAQFDDGGIEFYKDLTVGNATYANIYAKSNSTSGFSSVRWYGDTGVQKSFAISYGSAYATTVKRDTFEIGTDDTEGGDIVFTPLETEAARFASDSVTFSQPVSFNVGSTGASFAYTTGIVQISNADASNAAPIITSKTTSNLSGLTVATQSGDGNTGGDQWYYVSDASGGGAFTTTTNKAYKWSVYTTDVMSITRAGAATIGPSSQAVIHQFNGMATFRRDGNTRYDLTVTNLNSSSLAAAGLALTSDAGTAYIAKNSTTHTQGSLESLALVNETAGVYLSVAGTGWGSLSDMRYKTKVEDLHPVLDGIMTLSTFTYQVNESLEAGNAPIELGLSAQEVQEVIPELITGTEDKLGLMYSRVGVVALKAIQELKVQVNCLRDAETYEDKQACF